MAIPLTGTIGTTAPSDTFATHLSTLGEGGLHEVADRAARNSITTERRRRGMIVFTQDSGQYWSLTGTSNTGTDDDWTLLSFGTGAPAETQTFDFPTPLQSWVMNHTLGGKPTVVFTDLDGVSFEATPEYVSNSQVRVDFLVDGGMAGQAVLKSRG